MFHKLGHTVLHMLRLIQKNILKYYEVVPILEYFKFCLTQELVICLVCFGLYKSGSCSRSTTDHGIHDYIPVV